MLSPKNLNIVYGLFAGIVAYPVWLFLTSIFPPTPADHRNLSALIISVMAMISAATGMYIARKKNPDKYYSGSAFWTSLLIAVLFACLTLGSVEILSLIHAENKLTYPDLTKMVIALLLVMLLGAYAFIVALPFCYIGTLLFKGLILIAPRCLDRMREKHIG